MSESFEQDVISALESAEVLDHPKVDVKWDGPKLLAWVVSSAFESQEESDRQALLWKILEKKLGFEAMGQISFIFADAPSEAA